MKKFFVLILAVLMLATLSASDKFSELKLEKPIKISHLPTFVKKDLPALISLDKASFSGSLMSSNTISGVTIHRISWSYKSVPVHGRFTVLHEKNGEIVRLFNGMGSFTLDTTPKLSADAAAREAYARLTNSKEMTSRFTSELMIVDFNGTFKLAYKIRFAPTSPTDGRFFFVDAETGRVLRRGTHIFKALNDAWVFEFNPIRTPEPLLTELEWVADDADGYLVSELSDGYRKLMSISCVDEGETVDMGEYYGEMPVCTLRQRANKEENGDFMYEDWGKGLEGEFDIDDIYPEVSAYYHLQKIYDFILNIGLENFTELPNHVLPGHDGKYPFIGVVNFQMAEYGPGGKITLRPMDNAFYAAYDPMFNEYYFPSSELEGDMLVMGQGTRADFSYDGDVIYHEFGHGIIEGLTHLSYLSTPDIYGFSAESLALNEGMADIFSFLITNDECLGEYTSQLSMGMDCIRNATNTNIAIEDFVGESHNDGLPALAAHWSIYQKALEHGFTIEKVAKLFVSALLNVPHNDIGFKEWAEVFIATTEESEFAELRDDFEQILKDRGFYEEIRARDITRKTEYLMVGGKIPGYISTDTVYIEDEDEGIMEISPMYMQLYLDVPQCIDTLEFSASLMGEYGYNYNPKLQLLVRKGKPVIWHHSDGDITTMDYDYKITDYVKKNQSSVFTVENLEPGARYYFHFVNTDAPGYVYNPRTTLSWSSAEECTVVEPDEDVTPDSDTDPTVSDSDTDGELDFDDDQKSGKKDKSSGCSLSLI